MTLGSLSNYIAIVILVLGNPTCRCFDNFSKKGKSNQLCALTHQDTPMKEKKTPQALHINMMFLVKKTLVTIKRNHANINHNFKKLDKHMNQKR